MKNKELITRSLTGLVLVAVLCAAIYLGAWTTAALFLVIMCIGLHEWQNLMHKVGLNPNTFGMYILAILSYFWFCGKTLPIPWSYEAYCLVEIGLPALIIWCVLFIFISALFKKAERPMENIAVTLTGAIYIGIPFALLNFIINPFSNDGGAYPNILFGFFLLIWSSDVFAYLVGRSLGKHKLCERLSPSKTWEGVLGGLVATLGIAYLWSLYAIELNTEMWLLLALLIEIFGVLGDLIESMLKRSVKVKDSGSLLPGHGGVLDRFDSLLIAAPTVALCLWFYQVLYSL